MHFKHVFLNKRYKPSSKSNQTFIKWTPKIIQFEQLFNILYLFIVSVKNDVILINLSFYSYVKIYQIYFSYSKYNSLPV